MIFLVPAEVGLLVHFRAVFARRDRKRADMYAIGLGALQQRHMAQILRVSFERVQQVAEHALVGLDLLAFPPAGNQSATFVQSGIYQVRNVGQARGKLLGSGSVGQVQWSEARTMSNVGRPPRQSDNVAIGIGAERPDRRIADQPTSARNQDLLACHDSGLLRWGVGTRSISFELLALIREPRRRSSNLSMTRDPNSLPSRGGFGREH